MADIAALERRLAELRARDAELESRFNQLQPQVDAARARVREAEQRLAQIDSQFGRTVGLTDITRARQAAETNPNDAAARTRLQELQSQFAAQRQQRTEFLAEAQAQVDSARQAFRAAIAPQSEISTESEILERDIAQLQQQITSSRQQGPGTESTGETVAEAQVANDDRADVQAPDLRSQVLAPDGRIGSESPITVPSNAAGAVSGPDAGTDAAVRKADQTQAVPVAGAQTPIQPGSPSNRATIDIGNQDPPGSGTAPVPGAQRGAAADGDDNTNPTVSRINRIFGGPQATIRPAPNVLDQYASYTYNISIYLTNSQTYQQIRQNPAAGLLGANLLMQSGGAPLSSGVVSRDVGGDTGEIPGVTTQSLLTQGRNQEFPLDFYIDNLEIVSFTQGKGTGGAHNAVELSFQVLEPTGITFLDRLAAAVRRYVRGNVSNGQSNNYAAQAYLMVIRFWGYDADGNLVRAANAATTPGTAQEPGLIVEKYIPFRFTQIKFRLANRIAQYDCRAVCLRDYVAPSQSRGIIPYNIELTAVSLRDLLGVNLSFGTANQARDTEGRTGTTQQGTGTTSSTQATVTTNTGQFNSGVSYEGQVGAEFAAFDNFAIPGSTTATVDPPSSPVQSSAPPKATAAPSPVLVRGLTAALNEFQAQLVRNGTYELADVYEIIVNEPVLKEATLQPAEAAAGLRSVPMSAGQTAGAKKLGIKQQVNRDNKNVAAVAGMSIIQFLDQIVRNSSYITDQQTKIYKKDPAGKWVPQPRATGGQGLAWYRIGMDAVPISDRIDQKRNDRVYRITYTITPYLVNENQSGWFPASKFSGTHKKYQYWFTGLNTQIISYEQDYDYLYYITINNGSVPVAQSGDYREYTQRVFQARAPEASQGAAGPVFDPPALAAGSLYSPADTARIKMTIMGDPAWIQQGEISTGITELEENLYGPFLPDGTINYDSREPLFEVTFNTSGDYNLETGLMDVARRPS